MNFERGFLIFVLVLGLIWAGLRYGIITLPQPTAVPQQPQVIYIPVAATAVPGVAPDVLFPGMATAVPGDTVVIVAPATWTAVPAHAATAVPALRPNCLPRQRCAP